MLLNPKWQKDKHYSGVSLRAFTAWLESKPKNETYDYTQIHRCAIAQYKQSMGCPMGDCAVPLTDWIGVETLPGADWLNAIVHQRPWTFGEAAARARNICGND